MSARHCVADSSFHSQLCVWPLWYALRERAKSSDSDATQKSNTHTHACTHVGSHTMQREEHSGIKMERTP